MQLYSYIQLSIYIYKYGELYNYFPLCIYIYIYEYK